MDFGFTECPAAWPRRAGHKGPITQSCSEQVALEADVALRQEEEAGNGLQHAILSSARTAPPTARPLILASLGSTIFFLF